MTERFFVVFGNWTASASNRHRISVDVQTTEAAPRHVNRIVPLGDYTAARLMVRVSDIRVTSSTRRILRGLSEPGPR